MVSSSVYGIEDLLELIYTLLTSFGYEVWMSHKGTVPVFSNRTALENCLLAVQNADMFLGLITRYYGSSGAADLSFTHQEINKAIELSKLRWLLVHQDVVFARHFLKDLGYRDRKERARLSLVERATSINDLRVIGMYEDAIRNEIDLPYRQGNWVQKFQLDGDAQLFILSQLSRYQEVEQFIREQMRPQL